MKTVAFICIHNSCRSQMAEGWAKYLDSEFLEVYSAGLEDFKEVKPNAVLVMQEVGVDMSSNYPKLISSLPQKLDYVITMGCGAKCPFILSEHREDWGIVDPSGRGIDDFRHARDIIREKVLDLIERVKEE